MRVGVYIGSFNPVHVGHLHVANYLIENDYVDRVLLLATPNYWHKQNLIDIVHRENMLKFFENESIQVDTIHNKYTYTHEILDALERDYPSDEFYLILGSDNLEHLDKWVKIDEILKRKIIVLNRGNYNCPVDSTNMIFVNDFNYINISSTEIRNNMDTKYLPKDVYDYIKRNNLYSR